MNVYQITYVMPKSEQIKMNKVIVAPDDEKALTIFKDAGIGQLRIVSIQRVTTEPCLLWEKPKVKFTQKGKVKE